MPKIYEVSNVNDAVELAYKFKEEGTYNWFRGQVIDYLPHSSLHRKSSNPENTESIDFQYNLFIRWVKGTPELEYLLEEKNVHQLEAIMQHYGIPTHYIDFTTDPGIAAFFATDTKSPPATNTQSCIYCLDTKDLLEFWDIIQSTGIRKGAELETVVIDVQNLWRLQAQHGVFLKCNYNLEIDYGIDKIVFPYTGYPSYPTKEVIYPTQKSPLESLLDQYFERERTALLHKEFSKIATFIKHEELPNGVHEPAFIAPTQLADHKSWEQENNWQIYKTENYHQATGIKKTLKLSDGDSEDETRRKISYGVKQILRSNPSVRNQAIEWDIEGFQKTKDKNIATGLLAKVWNGMRLLPFNIDDISQACGNTIYLYIKSDEKASQRDEQSRIFSKIFGDSMRVGFANKDHSGSYGYASFNSINEALVLDMEILVEDDYKEIARDPFYRFQLIYNPRILFDFNKFKTFFAKEVIPSQLVWRPSLTIYNPSKLVTFGIP
jgi:hypothetical protein